MKQDFIFQRYIKIVTFLKDKSKVNLQNDTTL